MAPDGRVRFENEDWSTPTLQERRAILPAAKNAIDLPAAKNAIEELSELIEILQDDRKAGVQD